MVSFSAQSYSKRLLPLISWGHWFTFFNIIAAVVLSSFYLYSEPLPETLLGHAYLVTTWVSHISFLVFMCFVLVLFPLILVFPNTRFIRTSASVIYTCILLLLLLDAYVYSQLGYHLNASSSGQVIALISGLIEDKSRFFWSVSLFLCLILLSFQFVVSNYAWKHLRQLQKTKFANKVIIGLVSAFCFSHIVHIWADADLEYDILRQDSFLPLTYPSTAKTLLTKYGMFNRNDYIERKTAPLSFTEKVPTYPVLAQQCDVNKSVEQSVFVVLTNDMLTKRQINQISQRASASALTLQHHVDSASSSDAWFNLLYGLPSIYKPDLLNQHTDPVLFQAVEKLNLAKTLTLINENQHLEEPASWFVSLFDQTQYLENISTLVFAEKLNSFAAGIHFIYFTDGNKYQFELFMDALLSAQKQKESADIIWVSSLGNNTAQERFLSKPAVLLIPKAKTKHITELTSVMDLSPTLLNQWLSCDIDNKRHSNGDNITKLKKGRIIANSVKEGIMVFNKDKSVFIDQNGNFQSYSQQLETPIVVNPDFPLMIDGVHFIRQFTTINDLNNKAAVDH